MRLRRNRWKFLGLGVLAGALLHAPLHAQDTTRTPRRDTAAVIPIPPQEDSLVRRDSAERRPPAAVERVRADSIQASFARAALPLLTDAGQRPLVWSRDSIVATGAITLADLLERVPGLTPLRVSWVGLPTIGAYLGDVSRVRVFFDGLELDPEEPRGGATLDLTRVPIWLVDEMRVERTASEVRVHVRSWQVERTTPYSRVDVATGDQDTDVFRFFFGRRWGNGLGVQAAADQLSTTPDRVGATNSKLSLFGRVGWARAAWQADGTILRQSPDRGILLTDELTPGIPPIDLTRTEAYVRAGYGSADGPAWAQVMAGAHGYEYDGIRDPNADSLIVDVDPETGDTTRTLVPVDTNRWVGQYLATGGVNLGFVRASAAYRLRVLNGEAFHTPSGRLGVTMGPLAVALSGEWRGIDSIARADAGARVTPFRFLRLGGSVSLRDDGRAGGSAGVDWRGEGAVRIGQLWLGGGVMGRDATLLPAPTVFDSAYVPLAGPAEQGAYASIQGPLWGPLQVELLGEAWQADRQLYRPRYQTRADLFVRSNFLGRFPSGNFGLYALLRHEYRSTNYFPVEDGFLTASGHRILTGLLEIRILDATLSYQFRNLLATRFETVPGYQMPRQTQYYGVRWTFWN